MDFLTILQKLNPHKITIYKFVNNQNEKVELTINKDSNINFLLVMKNKTYYCISSLEPYNRCENCGQYYKLVHEKCNVNVKSYYDSKVMKITPQSPQWEPVNFHPIGTYKNTHIINLVYDIETVNIQTAIGTQLVPFMLVFKIDSQSEKHKNELIAHVEKFQIKNPLLKRREEFFYWLHIEKNVNLVISKEFRKLRASIQVYYMHKLINYIVNKDTIALFNNAEITSITAHNAQLQQLLPEPHCYEVNIIGHNISGFDEILLATQIVNEQEFELPAYMKQTKNFLPRNGKILFNDITLSIDNPFFKKIGKKNKSELKSKIENYKKGIIKLEYLKEIYIKIAVRDTYQLTHSSLRNVASAYGLKLEKGYCPFQAINEFITTDNYHYEDESKFPSKQYWNNEREYEEQLTMWKNKSTGQDYDLIHETLIYCIKDVEVTNELVIKLVENYKTFIKDEIKLPECDFNILQRPTISSNTQAIFKQTLFNKYSTEDDEQITCPGLCAPSNETYDFIRKSIRGGRCYPTYLGHFTEPIYVYDICGMYATALTYPLPYGTPLNVEEYTPHLDYFKDLLSKTEKIDYFDKKLLPMILSFNAYPPDYEQLDCLPPICSKQSGRLCWTNEPLENEIATSIDLITLHNRNWQVKIIDNIYNAVWPSFQTVCSDYVKINIQAKEKADKEKNQVLRSISKLLSNSLYGSFATKADNSIITFESQLTKNEKYEKLLKDGSYSISKMTNIPFDNIPSTSYQITNENYHYNFNIIDYCAEDVTFVTLSKNVDLIENKRYATQIACFVLGWTRTFTSEWADFLFKDQRGTDPLNRELRMLYGDTDSLFLTESGHEKMLTEGKHRLKANVNSLTFDETSPSIIWAVECETLCEKCGKDAYSTESVFLAPKLYALKNIQCESCNHLGKGKLRAKGHNKEVITYDILLDCLIFNTDKDKRDDIAAKRTNHITFFKNKFITKRNTLKRTLACHYGVLPPFTIHSIDLIREIRPWVDKTLYTHPENHKLLYPYDISSPNFRPSPQLHVNTDFFTEDVDETETR